MMTNNSTPISSIHECTLEVRDYECDMADGVNNSVYFNYLEHARHSMLKQYGIDFAELARQKVGLVIARAEIDFVKSLVSGDTFCIRTAVTRVSKLRFEFFQEIIKVQDSSVVLKAKITGVPINAAGKPRLTPELEKLVVVMCG
jgi:acyl-CoA thioester hydrolase